MKRQVIGCLYALFLICISACNNESDLFSTKKQVRFGVSTIYENCQRTRTEYSGKDQNNNNISSTSTAERINWLPTDKIRIICEQALSSDNAKYADYTVTPKGNGTNQTHSARISPVEGGNGLKWGSGNHNFFALYPSTLQNTESEIISDASGTKATVYGTIPSDQSYGVNLEGRIIKPNMDYAYMYAIAPSVNSGDEVTLNFKPLITTVEFTLITRNGDAITSNLTSVELSSAYSTLAGSFSAELSTTGISELSSDNITDGAERIIIRIPGDGVALSTTEPYTVTFLTLPFKQKELTLTLNFADGTKRTLALKNGDEWVELEACKKTYIWKLDVPLTIDSFVYVFEVNDPTDLTYDATSASTNGSVLSYKYKSSTPETHIPVGWVVDGYYMNEMDALNAENAIDINNTFLLSFEPESQNGSDTGESVSIIYTSDYEEDTEVDASPEILDKLKSNSGAYVRRGSPASYWNLSNPSTGSKSHISETANTYIVNAPGYYCFPLVMGNGVKNDQKNEVAYKQRKFCNYKGTLLSTDLPSPFIQDDGDVPESAFIVWEEVKMVAIENESSWNLEIPQGETNAITKTSMVIDGETREVYWLNIRITDEINQGCAVIAVKNEEGTVMWSWTIWVTDYIPQDGRPFYNDSSSLADVECDFRGTLTTFMPRNLGWVETGNTIGISYPQKTVYVRLRQVGNASVAVMRITRPFHCEVNGGSVGHNPFFQYGRKDPIIPGYPGNTGSDGVPARDVPVYGTVTSIQTKKATRTTGINDAITNPGLFFTPFVGDASTWCNGIGGTAAQYLWNAGAWGFDDRKVVKTIYDPCPAGYTVPRKNAFRVIMIPGLDGIPNAYYYNYNGFYFWNHSRDNESQSTDGMKTFYLPLIGCRSADSGQMMVGGPHSSGGYYWLAAYRYKCYFNCPSSGIGKIVDLYLTGGNDAHGYVVRPAREEP